MENEELIIWEEPKMRVQEYKGETSIMVIQRGRHMITGEETYQVKGMHMGTEEGSKDD